MRILIVADLHHPEELAHANAALIPGELPLLFPPSQGAYFWTRALRKQGHTVEAFVRSDPALFGKRAKHREKFTGRFSLGMVSTALSARLPRLHPDFRLRNQRFMAVVESFAPDVILSNGRQPRYLPGNHWLHQS